MPSNWVPLDPEEWNKPRRGQIRGVNVDVYMSPQDVPEAVQGFYDASISRFAIEFRYPTGDEPVTKVEYDQHITLLVGKNSKRLYRVLIDVDKLRASGVGLRMYVQSAFKDVRSAILAEGRNDPSRQGSYQIAEQVIDRHGSDLLEAVPG